MLHARPRCRGVDLMVGEPGYAKRCASRYTNVAGMVGEPGYAKRCASRYTNVAGMVGEPRYAWTLSVAGGYNRCVQLFVSLGVTIPFGGGQPTAPFGDCLIGVALAVTVGFHRCFGSSGFIVVIGHAGCDGHSGVVIRIESAVDGISKAVVLLQF